MTRAKFDQKQGRVSVGPWTWPAHWIRGADDYGGRRGHVVALLGIRRGLDLLVQGDEAGDHFWVELWTGDPASTDGAAVVVSKNGQAAIATVPLCGCGVRGCGNAGVQLATEISAENLPGLVRLLQELEMTVRLPTRANIWMGVFQSGRPT